MVREKTGISMQKGKFAMSKDGAHMAVAGEYTTSAEGAAFLYGLDNVNCQIEFSFDFNITYSTQDIDYLAFADNSDTLHAVTTEELDAEVDYSQWLWIFNLAWGNSFNIHQASSVRAYKLNTFGTSLTSKVFSIEPVKNSNEVMVVNMMSLILVDANSGFNNLLAHKIDTSSLDLYNLAAHSYLSSAETSMYSLQITDTSGIRVVKFDDFKSNQIASSFTIAIALTASDVHIAHLTVTSDPAS